MKNKIEKINKQYEDLCLAYISMFASKQELSFHGWVGAEVGGIAVFSEFYFFNFSDIIFDLTNECTTGLIIDYQERYLDATLSGGTYFNYRTYISLYDKKHVV